jgi:hypothetical protein
MKIRINGSDEVDLMHFNKTVLIPYMQMHLRCNISIEKLT